MDLVAEAQAFFFDAMLSGWASNSGKQLVPDKPGHKRIVHISSDGRFRLMDEYCIRLGSRYSAGTTTIWAEGDLVWVMQYQGWYSEIGSAICKAALRRAYADTLWLGGRGPAHYSDIGHVYINQASGDFTMFDGREVVFPVEKVDPTDTEGTHRYFGFWMRTQ